MAHARFEDLVAAVEQTLGSVLQKRLPPEGPWKELWVEPSSLVALGMVFEQEKFYVSFSFGELKSADPFVRRNMSRPAWDYLESSRLNAEHFPDVDTGHLSDVWDRLWLEAPEGFDEDDFSDSADELRRLMTLTSLCLFGLRLRSRASGLPMPLAPNFEFVVSDDVESPTIDAPVPAVSFAEPELRERLLDAWCGSAESRALLDALIDCGDEDEPPALSEAVARLTR